MENQTYYNNVARIMIVGIGGGGGNAVDSMMKAGIRNVEFLALNTDQQALNRLSCKTLAIGEKLTKGLGAGPNPEIGREAAQESREIIQKELGDVDLLFIAAGMGGGTGTGAAPVVANIAKQLGILTIAVVTKPFNFEGTHRMRNAEMGINNLKGNVDALVIVQNEKLNRDKNFSIMDAFVKADEILLQGIRGITDIVLQSGRINLDLADVKCVMKDSGMAHMGIGSGKGKNKTIDAIRKAVYSPLLETTIQGAAAIIINIRGGDDLTLDEVTTGVDLVKQVIDPDANVLFGVGFDETLKDEVQVTLIATGFSGHPNEGNPSFFTKEGGITGSNSVASGIVREPLDRSAATNAEKESGFSGNLKVDEDKNIPPFLRKMQNK